MCKVSGAKTVIIADIQKERVEFAIKHGFADGSIVVPMKRPVEVKEKLEFAKEVADLVGAEVNKPSGSGGKVDAVFECTGVESCLQAAIYVRSSRPPSP